MSEKYLGENSTPILINQIKDKLTDNYKVQGELGAKNLIPYPYVSRTPVSQDGITYTANSDGSVTVDGTALANKYSNYYLYESNKNILPYGQYILSTKERLPQGVVIRIQHISDSSNIVRLDSTMDSVEFTINDDTAQRLFITVTSNTTVNNATIYPMIRLASDTDPTWRPYAKTNYELTQDTDIPIVRGTGNNSIILNSPSTNTANGSFSVAEGNTSSAGSDYSHAEGYYCRAQGQRSHAQNSGTVAQGYSQTVIGKYNVLQGTSTSNQDNDYALIIGNGTNTNNRSNALAVQWDGTVVMQDGSTMKSAKTVYEVMGKMGAKNLLKYPYLVNSARYNGVTFTAQTDGSITANGTATGYSHMSLNINVSNPSIYTFRTLPQGKYIMSLESNDEFTGDFSFLVRYKFTDGTPYIDNQVTISSSSHYNKKVFEITQEYAEKMQNNTMYFEIRVLTNNGVANNIVLYPMIYLADDQDDTWQQYAMTNKELTDKINSLKTIVANSTDFVSFKTAIANW